MSLEHLTLIGPLAYQGKKDCQNARCTRRIYPDGSVSQDCAGWHCSYCNSPCGSQGHRCDASEAILGESERIARLDFGDA